MIPKIIHYCWFGRGQKPALAIKCINSWQKYCPDYEIKEWNEDNFDIQLYPYIEEAYKARKFAFVTDVVRLYVLYNYGGIYMDTDVEVIKPLDILLSYDAVSGFESDTQIPTGLMASREGHPLFKEFLDEYNGLHFVKPNGELDFTTNVTRITRICNKYGFNSNNTLQVINGFTLLPKDYLCPKSYADGKIRLTSNTLTIHHFSGSWISKSEKMKNFIARLLGKKIVNFYTLIKHKLLNY